MCRNAQFWAPKLCIKKTAAKFCILDEKKKNVREKTKQKAATPPLAETSLI